MKNKKILTLVALSLMSFPFFSRIVIAEEINKTDIVVKNSFPDDTEAEFIEEYIDKMLTLVDSTSYYEAGSGFGKMVEDENLHSFDSVGYINWGVYQSTSDKVLGYRDILASDFTNSGYFNSGDWDSIKTDTIIGDVIVSNDNSLFSVYVGKNSSDDPIFLTCVGNPFVRSQSTSAVRLVNLDDLGKIDGYYMLPEKLADGPLEDTLFSSDFDRDKMERVFKGNEDAPVVDPGTLVNPYYNK